MEIVRVDIHPKYDQPYNGFQNQFSDWILDAALSSDLYINQGLEHDVQKGDYIRSVNTITIKDATGNTIGTKNIKDHNLIKVVEVHDTFCMARIESFGYHVFFDKIFPELLYANPEGATFHTLFPYKPGQKVEAISRPEGIQWDSVLQLYNQLSGETRTVALADIGLYEKMVNGCNQFINDHNPENSHFYSDALYQKGFALHKLKRFEESNESFNQYLDRFPDGISVAGAHSWINENNQHLVVMESVHKKTILFLAANPVETSRLKLDNEIREIDLQLRLAKQRDRFRLEQKWAIRPNELQQALLDHKPDIVHFSGHGKTEGIALESQSGGIQIVSTQAISSTFGILADNIQCVVLNSCYSKAQAEAIAEHIPYVIGMNQAIEDKTAIGFAIGFYKGVGAGKSIEVSFELGKNMIELEGLSGESIPELITKR